MKDQNNSKKTSKTKNILYFIIMFFISLVIMFIISEVFLRVVPIPGIKYDISKYDSIAGGGYYPNSINYYRNDRGDFVKRHINEWGYFDKDYRQKKEKRTTRIGFFGDSYTTVLQIPLKETYHQIIEDSLKSNKIETLSFGVEGFSTFQSYLTFNKWVDFFDIDVVVYVFCENDLGDQIREVKKTPYIPYPILKEGQINIDNSFREIRRNRSSLSFKIFDYLTSHSLVFATLSQRAQLLLKHGIKMNVTKEERFMKTQKEELGSIKYTPNLSQSDNASVWPDSLKKVAIDLEEKIILKWKNEIEEKQKSFLILYTPREIYIPTFEQDTWKPWLHNFCANNNIPFIDPTENLKKMELNGNKAFYDHYTKYGHKAVANTFVEWYSNN